MEWPTLFAWDYDEPRLEAFRPVKPIDSNEVEPTEENLAELIRTKQVIDAYKMFDKLDIMHQGNFDRKDLMVILFY